MPRFDLGNAVDFAKVTNSSLLGILNSFSNKAVGDWQIEEASFRNIKFHIFKSKSDGGSYNADVSSVNDNLGRRKVKYRFPYIDGQTTDDMGAQPGVYEFDVLIYGADYKAALARLLEALNNPKPGVLIHPVLGSLTVVPVSFPLTHSHERRKAVALRITFEDHSFTVAQPEIAQRVNPVKSTLTKAIESLQKISSFIDKVQKNLKIIQSFKNLITQALKDYQNGYARVLTQSNATFNPSGGVDIPAVIPVQAGGNYGQTDSTLFPLSVAPTDPFANVPFDVISSVAQTAVAVDRLTKDVNALRDQVSAIIASLEASINGQGSLEFYDDILDLKNSAADLQAVIEAGIASSRAKIIMYKVPRIMSLREVAFANGLKADQVTELDLLNPSLESINYIPKGTKVKVAVSV